jgi:hypothetical protein
MAAIPGGGLVDTITGEVQQAGVLVWVPRRSKDSPEFFMGYHEAFEKLALDKSIAGRPRRVLDLLFARLSWENYIAISQTEIAQLLDIYRPDVSAALKLLIERGILEPGPKVGRNATYKLNPEYAWKGREKTRKADIKRRMTATGLTVVKGGVPVEPAVTPNDSPSA